MSDSEIDEILRGEFTLDIPNFEKWNPKDKRKRHWIALDIHFDRDPRLIRLAPVVQLLFIKLCCLRGSSCEPPANLTLASLQPRVNLRSASCKVGLLKLLKLRLIDIRLSNLHTDRHTDIGGEVRQKQGTTPPEIHPLKTEIRTEEERGPVEELLSVRGSAFLKRTLKRSQMAWIHAFGLELVQRELPLAIQAWESNEERQKKGNFPLYLSSWFRNTYEALQRNSAPPEK